MDKTITTHPVVVLANWFQFGAHERLDNPRVLSRMLLWSRAGRGRVRVNGQWQSLEPEQWLLLPWSHAVEYAPDAKRPFCVGGIHLIPDHECNRPVEFRASHRPGDGLEHLATARRDRPIAGTSKFVRGHFADAPRLRLLATYVVERFQAGPQQEQPMRELANLLLAELQQAILAGAAEQLDQPTDRLRRMQQYIRRKIAQPVTIDALARIAGCSPATVHRLFLKAFKTSPLQWHAAQRVEMARQLLGGTSLPVREVAARVGFDDPFHFSRFFKHHAGTNPRAYRQQTRLM